MDGINEGFEDDGFVESKVDVESKADVESRNELEESGLE